MDIFETLDDFAGSGWEAAGEDMIYNIDNYMNWMYNRWVDRPMCRLSIP